jgi:uncharacterized membrane protein
MLIGYLVTGSWKLGAAIGGIEVITKMLLYFAHERIWQNIEFGKTS